MLVVLPAKASMAASCEASKEEPAAMAAAAAAAAADPEVGPDAPDTVEAVEPVLLARTRAW